MDRMMFCSLMESSRLLRDSSKFLEATSDIPLHRRYTPEELAAERTRASANLKPGEKAPKVGRRHPKPVATLHVDPEVRAKIAKDFPDDPTSQRRALLKHEGSTVTYHDDVHPNAREIPHSKLRMMDPESKAARTAHGKTFMGRMERVYRGGVRTVRKAGGKLGDTIERVAGSAGGGLKTVAKYGAVPLAAFLAGRVKGAHDTKKYVDKLPAVQKAKEWGPWIKKAKKYGPYALAAGGGLLAARALSGDD